jgi:hypothetical protein
VTRDEHHKRHLQLHAYLEELVADFVAHTRRLPSETTILQLAEWSYTQTVSPDVVGDLNNHGGRAS